MSTSVERFEGQYTPEPMTGCWLWLGSLDNGYPTFREGGRKSSVTRAVLGLNPGDGLQACHRCDNPPCMNPAHLFAGTHEDNMRDALAKGRMYRKLSHRALREIVERCTSGESQASVARAFGVSKTYVSFIALRVRAGRPAKFAARGC